LNVQNLGWYYNVVHRAAIVVVSIVQGKSRFQARFSGKGPPQTLTDSRLIFIRAILVGFFDPAIESD
jgi:hypothetical protein